MSGRSVAIYLPDLSGGGAERLHVQLAPMFADLGLKPRFLLDRRSGALLDSVPAGIPIDILGARRQVAALPRLIRYFRDTPPDVLIANMEHMNVMAVLAKRIARAPTRIVATQHNAFSEQVKRRSWQWRALPTLYRHILPGADAIVSVSAGVADDLADRVPMPRDRITVIHNGVIASDFNERLAGEPDHPWFAETDPVLVAMGRLVAQKDFTTLVEAMARIDPALRARLIILGEGPLRGELEGLAAARGLKDRIAFPGFTQNPLPWLRRSQLFVMSSRFEGFGNVIAEALACGTPVVSTNCPHGPSEILDGGRYGDLVPVGDPDAMARALEAALQRPEVDRAGLSDRGRGFSVERCARSYHELIGSLG